MLLTVLVGLALTLCPSVLAQITPGPIVTTTYGQVQGNSVPMSEPEGVVYSFWNLPYAKPPVGNLRFEPPSPPEPWTGVWYNDSIGVSCPQSGSLFILTQPGYDNFDEDCLYLNVFTADLAASNPVMVFFHGGGFTSGGSIQYPGHFLAKQHGLVIVTVNYRLGNLGFVTTGDSVVPGNAGLYDQRQALIWVQENIAAFGGNPASVTIFGQSAGAASSSHHIMSPLSTGLFHRAIMESGTDFSLWAINWPVQNPANYTRQVAAKNGCPTTDSQQMIDCLRTVPWQQLWNTSFDCAPGTFCQGMAPVIDGPGGFIPENPITARANGQLNRVPIITGICREDGSLYTLTLLPDTSQGFNRSEFERNLRDELLVWFTSYFPPEREEDVFNAINWYYSPWPHVDDEYLNREAFNFMVTDAGFGYAADIQAKHQSQYADSYFYVFGFRSSNASILVPEWMGVPHMGEIPYVFGYPLLQLNRYVRQDCRIFDIIPWNDEDIAYANYFMTIIANFAKTSNPTPQPITPPTGGAPLTWTPLNGQYRDNLDLTYLLVDNVTNEVRTDYRQHAYSFWTEYLAYFGGYDLVPPNVPIAPVASAASEKKRRPPRSPLSQNKYTPIKRRSMSSDEFGKKVDALIEELAANAMDS